MKKIVYSTLIVLLSIILVLVIIMFLNPLRRSEEQIKRNMLKLTPIGTSMEVVISIIDGNKWKYHVRDYGYFFIHGLPSRHASRPAIGVKSIDAYLGEYRTIFLTGVSVFYGFDEDSILIDIAVLKEVDGL